MKRMENCDDIFIGYAMENNLSAVTKLLENDANVHAKDDFALRYSATCGRVQMVSKLLEYGANIDVHDGSILIQCANHNNATMVSKLLEWGANVHVRDDIVLRCSVGYNNLPMISELLERGANLWCDNGSILNGLKDSFNKELADVILPYCNSDDYEYFPIEYINANIAHKKSASTCSKN